MLRKLLKYDLRSSLKTYLFIWPAIVVFALIARLTLLAKRWSSSTLLVSTTLTIFVLAIVAACIFSLILSITRFYRGLLRDEGYLMFTLPVRPWQLLLSKFLTAVLTIAVTLSLSFLAVWYLFDGVHGFYYTVRYIWRHFSLPDGITLCLYLLIAAAALCLTILQIYLSCSIGHLFRKHRVLWSFLVYYGINILFEVIFVSTLIDSSVFYVIERGVSLNFALGVALFFEVALGALFFFLSEHILRRNLNLE